MLWLCQITFAGVGALAAGTARHQARVADAPGGDRRRRDRGRDRLDHRSPDHPARQPVRRAGHADLRALDGTPRVQPGDVRPVRHRASAVARPDSRSPTRRSSTSALAVFAVFAILIVNLRRSTTGLALNAVRWSENASRTMGLSVIQMKMLVSGLAAFVAGVGGGLFAMARKQAIPLDYVTLLGLVWLAVLVTFGVRSNIAALLAGSSSSFARGLPTLLQARAPRGRTCRCSCSVSVRSGWRRTPRAPCTCGPWVQQRTCTGLGSGARAVPRPPRSRPARSTPADEPPPPTGLAETRGGTTAEVAGS